MIKKLIALTLAFTFMILITGCSKQENTPDTSTEIESVITEDDEWIPYDPDKITSPDNDRTVQLGSEETGYLMLSGEYEASDLSEIFHIPYFMGAGTKVGVALVLSEDSMDDILSESYGQDGYNPSEIITIIDNNTYIAKQYYASYPDGESHYCTTCIENKETGKVIIISVATLSAMSIDEFAGYNIGILETHTFNCFHNLVEKETIYETE